MTSESAIGEFSLEKSNAPKLFAIQIKNNLMGLFKIILGIWVFQFSSISIHLWHQNWLDWFPFEDDSQSLLILVLARFLQ